MDMYSLVRTNQINIDMGSGTRNMAVLQCCSIKNSVGDLQGHRQTWKKTNSHRPRQPQNALKECLPGLLVKVCFLP